MKWNTALDEGMISGRFVKLAQEVMKDLGQKAAADKIFQEMKQRVRHPQNLEQNKEIVYSSIKAIKQGKI